MTSIPSIPSREFIGHAGSPPVVQWPDDARVAVNFCINYEEGGELCVLNGDDRSEERLSDVAVTSRVGRRDQMGTVLLHLVHPSAGGESHNRW